MRHSVFSDHFNFSEIGISMSPENLVRVLRQTVESDSFRWIVVRQHLTEAADTIERLEREVNRHEESLRILAEQYEEAGKRNGW